MDSNGFQYLKTSPGLLFKVLETFFAFITFACSLVFATTWSYVHIAFFNALLTIALCFTITITILNIIHLISRVPHISWNKVDCFILIVLLFVSSTIWINHIKPIDKIFRYISGIFTNYIL